MKAEVFEDWESLASLEPEWNALLQRSSANSIFLTWEWIEAWHEVVRDSVRPCVVAVRDARGALAGIAPLYWSRLRLLRLVPYRTLRILGDFHTGAEYADFIVAPECEAGAARAIADALVGLPRRWDCLWVPRVAGWTGAYERIATGFGAARLVCRSRSCEFSSTPLPRDFASFKGSLSGNARSALARQTRAVLGAGDVRFEACGSPADLPAYLQALFELNHRRWSAAGQAGTFVRKPLERRFYEAFARRAQARGWLRIFALRQGARFLAVQFGYAYGSCFLQLQEGLDPEAPAGIGNVLRLHVVERCIQEGLTTYDFLGEHTEHKRRWLASARPGHELLVLRRSLRNALPLALPLWPTGRYLRETPLPGSLAEASWARTATLSERA